MASMWGVAKALQIPLDRRVKNISELPYTLSFVIRKRSQVDNLMELPKDKQPPELMLWDGTPEDIEDWVERVILKNEPTSISLVIDEVE